MASEKQKLPTAAELMNAAAQLGAARDPKGALQKALLLYLGAEELLDRFARREHRHDVLNEGDEAPPGIPFRRYVLWLVYRDMVPEMERELLQAEERRALKHYPDRSEDDVLKKFNAAKLRGDSRALLNALQRYQINGFRQLLGRDPSPWLDFYFAEWAASLKRTDEKGKSYYAIDPYDLEGAIRNELARTRNGSAKRQRKKRAIASNDTIRKMDGKKNR